MHPTDIYAAIAEPTRRTILEMLAADGEMSSTEISKRFRISKPAVSQHLKVLRDARLVRVEKRAQQRIYQFDPEAMKQFEDWVRHMTTLWTERFDRLDAVLKSLQARESTSER